MDANPSRLTGIKGVNPALQYHCQSVTAHCPHEDITPPDLSHKGHILQKASCSSSQPVFPSCPIRSTGTRGQAFSKPRVSPSDKTGRLGMKKNHGPSCDSLGCKVQTIFVETMRWGAVIPERQVHKCDFVTQSPYQPIMRAPDSGHR